MLGNRLVGENLDPYLTATLGVTGHSDTGSLDLCRSDPCRLSGHQTVLTVGNFIAAGSHTGHTTSVLLAVLNTLR